MKKLFTLLIFMTALLPAHAQRIVVEKNDNVKFAADLHDFRRITFNGNTVNIIQNNGTVTNAEMEDIVKIYFDDYTRITNTDIDENKELISYITSEEISVNCEAGEEIAIYNISGCIIRKEIQDSHGGSISIAGLPKGIYLLKANRQTVKLIKK